MTILKTTRVYECDQCHKQITVEGEYQPEHWAIVAVQHPSYDGTEYRFDLCSQECHKALLEKLGIADGSH